eukprot:7531879-Pyramimonas_sp.AAC.1
MSTVLWLRSHLGSRTTSIKAAGQEQPFALVLRRPALAKTRLLLTRTSDVPSPFLSLHSGRDAWGKFSSVILAQTF